MKQISLLLFLCIASLTTMAQESIPQDTIIYFNGRKLVVQERGNKIKVKMYESQKENDTIENAQVFEGVYLDGVSVERTTVVSLPFTTKKSKSYSGYRFRPHYPTLYFGFDKLGGGAFQYSADVPQIGSKSWEWGMNICSGGIAFTSNNHWGITSAFGFARIDYKLDNNYGFEKVDGVTVCRQASDDIEYSKSWLRYWAFRIPISIEWQTKFGSSRAYITAGPELEWRLWMKSRAKYDGRKHTLSGKLNSHPIGLNMLMQAGYGSWVLTGRFAMTSLFEKNKGPELYPASLGVGWCW